jgi:hypothetical protein
MNESDLSMRVLTEFDCSHSYQASACVSAQKLGVLACFDLAKTFAAACTCPGESHPGPVRKNGKYVGRSAPEIDIFEAQVDKGKGQVGLSAKR